MCGPKRRCKWIQRQDESPTWGQWARLHGTPTAASHLGRGAHGAPTATGSPDKSIKSKSLVQGESEGRLQTGSHTWDASPRGPGPPSHGF